MEWFAYFCATVIFILCYKYFYYRDKFRYWQDKCIPVMTNPVPFFGNVASLFFFREHLFEFLKTMYKTYPDASMVGFYYHQEPCLLLRDPELIKAVLVSNFVNFADNDIKLESDQEPLLQKNPFFTTGQLWKLNRTRLSILSSANKLHALAHTVKNILDDFMKYTSKKINDNGGYVEVDAKEYLSIYTAELVAGIGFGIYGKSFEDSTNEDTFSDFSKYSFGSTWMNRLRMVLLVRFPELIGYLNMSFFPKKFETILNSFVKMELQKGKKSSTKNSFIDMIINLESKTINNPEQLERDVSSYMAALYLDLYETTASTLVFIAYHLSVNPRIQDKLRQEIISALEDNDLEGDNVINKLVYMEQVIYESLRLQPTVGHFTRRCTEKTELHGSDGLFCVLEPGARVFVSIDGIHKDEQFWTDPEIFDPDRFSKNVLTEQQKSVFMGFGAGPRMCPGKRLGMLSMKMALCRLLQEFSIELSPKTKLPFRWDSFLFLRIARDGVWLKLKPLNSR